MGAAEKLGPEYNEVDLNQQKFATVKALGADDPDFLVELYDIFKQRVPELLDKMESSMNQGDDSQLEKAAHALKGTSGNIGAEKMMKICEFIECSARNEKRSNFQEYLPVLKESFQK